MEKMPSIPAAPSVSKSVSKIKEFDYKQRPQTAEYQVGYDRIFRKRKESKHVGK